MDEVKAIGTLLDYDYDEIADLVELGQEIRNTESVIEQAWKVAENVVIDVDDENNGAKGQMDFREYAEYYHRNGHAPGGSPPVLPPKRNDTVQRIATLGGWKAPRSVLLRLELVLMPIEIREAVTSGDLRLVSVRELAKLIRLIDDVETGQDELDRIFDEWMNETIVKLPKSWDKRSIPNVLRHEVERTVNQHDDD